MSPTNNRFNGPVIVFSTLVLCVIAYQTNAMRATAMMQPTVIATVDLEKIFGMLDRVGVAQKALEVEIQTFTDANEVMRESIRGLQADQEDFPPGSEKFQEFEDRILRAAFKLRADVEFIKGFMEQGESDIIRDTYLQISASAKLVAVAKGVDMVFVDDSILQINRGTVLDVKRQIAARRMLYANPNLDITADVVALMNQN